MSGKMNWNRWGPDNERWYSVATQSTHPGKRIYAQVPQPMMGQNRRAWIMSLTGIAKHRHFSQNIKPGQRSLTCDEIYEIYGVK